MKLDPDFVWEGMALSRAFPKKISSSSTTSTDGYTHFSSFFEALTHSNHITEI